MLGFDPTQRRSILNMALLRIVTIYLFAVLASLVPVATDAKTPAKPNPLFANSEILEITITAPFSMLMRERPVDEDVAGQLTYSDADLGEVVLDIGIRTRGRYRQQKSVCPFAPLRLNFKKKATDKTVFRQTDKIKLVTHCRDGSERYSQGVLREYLAYRIFNTMTDKSFRVRLLQVTYVETDSQNPDKVNFAFLIEHRDKLAKRLGMKVLDIEKTTVEALDPRHTNLASVFQYFIGNTDFSPIRGAKGEPCCHNYVLMSPEGGPIFSIPYDLDMSGLVNARHATPNPRFRIRSVRTRLYRGRCANNEYLDETLQAYRDRKQDIYQLVTGLTELSNDTRKRITGYIDDFYAIIDNQGRVESRMKARCI
jgi:hypothetical protein